MIIPVDLPFLGDPNIKHKITKNPIAWTYPWSPMIVFDIPDEVEEFEAYKISFLLSHEITHIYQMKYFKPLTLLLWNVINSSYNAPATNKFGKKECESINKIITAWAPILEGDAILDFLVLNIGNPLCEEIIEDFEKDGNETLIDGLCLILNIKRNDFNWKALYKVLNENIDDVMSLLEKMHVVLNVVPFLETPFENIENDWESLCYKIAMDSIQGLSSFLKYPTGHPERERIWKDVCELNKKIKPKWQKLFENLFKSKKDIFLNFLLSQIFNTNFPMWVPLLFSDGQIEILQIARGGKACLLNKKNKMWDVGHNWILHLISLEIARSLSDSEEISGCPLFKMNLGSGCEYFCGDANPSLEWCTFCTADKIGSRIDISYRSKHCAFWDMMNFKILRQLEEFTKKSMIVTSWGNKLFFERSKGYVLDHLPKEMEDTDLSIKDLLTKDDIKKFIEELPEHYLTSDWKERIVEELNSSDARWITLTGTNKKNKTEKAESKEEFLMDILKMLEKGKIKSCKTSSW